MFKGTTEKNFHLYGLATTIIICIAWFLPEYNDVTERVDFTSPAPFHLSLPPAILMSSTEFQDPDFQSKKKKEVQARMDLACEITTNDVVFAFQWRYLHNNRSLNDHIFMLCRNHRIFANALFSYHGDDYIQCTEEYGGVLKSKRRHLNVTLKGIDVNTFQHVEYESKSPVESCLLQHSVDMLNRKW